MMMMMMMMIKNITLKGNQESSKHTVSTIRLIEEGSSRDRR